VLGSDQALEDDIRMQAGILDKLLTPLLAPPVEVNGSGLSEEIEPASAGPEPAESEAASGEPAPAGEASADESAAADSGEEVDEDALDEAWEEQDGEAAGRRGARGGRARLGLRRRRGRREETEPAAEETEPAADETEPAADETAFAAKAEEAEPARSTGAASEDEAAGEPVTASAEAGRAAAAAAASGQSVYELPEWMPEQRAQLSILLEEAGISYGWEAGDLVVPAAKDGQVEELFSRVDGVAADEDEEARYRALEDLFAAADRFVNDPDSESKAADVVRAASAAEGPTPVGVDEATWWSIRQRARTVAASIEGEAGLDVIFGEAKDLRDELRPLM